MAASFLITPSRVISGRDTRTTCIIKNIPNRLSLPTLIELIDDTLAGSFNHLHMPTDARSRHNLGYAFINFESCESVLLFWERWNGRPWKSLGFKSNKVSRLEYARMQFE